MMKSNRMKNALLLMTLLTVGLIPFLSGCGSQEEKVEAKSMEEIRKEEGVPVQIDEVLPQNFEKRLTFYANLSGIREATKYSSFGDKIVKINAQVGQNVKEDQIIVEFPKDNPSMQYEQTKAAYELSKKTLERMEALLEAGETSQQNYDQTNTQYLVNKRNFEAMKQMIMVESPISGTIVEMFVKEGEDIDSRKPLFTVAQLDQMKAKLWVSEEEVRRMRVGMPATISSGGQEVQGRVSEVALSMDEFRRAFGVEVRCPNPKRILKSGVTADVSLVVYSKKDAVVIPRKLVKKEEGREFVYLAKNSKAEKRFIETGVVSGINVEVLQGLNPGDKLITKGDALLEKGVKIKVTGNSK